MNTVILTQSTRFSFVRTHPNFTGCLKDKFYTTAYYKNGKVHREDGPAVIEDQGEQFWCLEGEEYTEQEHRLKVRQMKMKLLDVM